MAKTERIFPLSTTGGRIQDLRHKAGLKREAFYDTVYSYGSASDPAHKEKTVWGWESGKHSPDYEILAKICKVLRCDADYLLCLQETPRKEYAHIADETGLSISAAEYLSELKGRGMTAAPMQEVLSAILVQMKSQEENNSDRALLPYLTYYMLTDYFPAHRGESGATLQDRDYDADWGALQRELARFTNDYRQKRFHTD